MTIGIIVPEFINSFFPYVIIGAQEIANPAGYHVFICQSNESYETEIANTNVLMSSRVDGILASLTGRRPISVISKNLNAAEFRWYILTG